ncbi:hypothetical protein SCHPADRAFT_730297 [Schizopora paradoxa]|uniref:Uncharacterized protein n=1 Tax=Schizopora paradoxa TaxID=27342 RepID=A0A0H2R0N2_9AGAM|nr:hypothetical protein SCHPADRAFT_730297 [Schizopora paradoxa]
MPNHFERLRSSIRTRCRKKRGSSKRNASGSVVGHVDGLDGASVDLAPNDEANENSQPLAGPVLNERTRSSAGDRIGRVLRSPVTQVVLFVTSTVADAVPIAGPPIKAVIDLLRKVLKLFDAINKNKKLADMLLLKLEFLLKCIENVDHPPDLETLEQHLNRALDFVKEMHTNSVLSSTEIGEQLKECDNSIMNYMTILLLSDTISNPEKLKIITTLGTIQGPGLQTFIATQTASASVSSEIRVATVTFIDPRRMRVEIERYKCSTPESFKACLFAYYAMDSSTPIRGSEYVKAGNYFLSFDEREVSPSELENMDPSRNRDLVLWWDKIIDGNGPLQMGVVISKINQASSESSDRCFRCHSVMARSSNGQQTECLRCEVSLSEPEHCDINSLTEDDKSKILNETKNGECDTDFYANIKFRYVDLPPPSMLASSTSPSSWVYPRTPHWRPGGFDDTLAPGEPGAPLLERPVYGFTNRDPTLRRSSSRASMTSNESNKSYRSFDASSYVDPAILASGESTLLKNKKSSGSGFGASGD